MWDDKYISLFPFCQRQWMIARRLDIILAPFTLDDGYVRGTDDGVVRLASFCQATHSIPHLLSAQPQHPVLRTPLCVLSLAYQRHLEETIIWQILRKNILLFKSYYRGGLIAACGNIPGETNHCSW